MGVAYWVRKISQRGQHDRVLRENVRGVEAIITANCQDRGEYGVIEFVRGRRPAFRVGEIQEK